MSSFTGLALIASMLSIDARAAPTKVLPLGDSITFGCGDQCAKDCMKDGSPFTPCSTCSQGWRGPLWKKLTGDGGKNSSADWDFVGTQQNGPDEIDRSHEGHPGWTNEQIEGISDKWVPLKPDVILLHLGTNNLGIGNQDAKTALGHMESLLNTTFGSLPHVRLLLSTLIGSSATNYDGKKHAEYNVGIKEFAKRYAALGRNIELVDMDKESGIGQYCDSTNCCPTGIHPNDIGYKLVGDVWYTHLTSTSNVSLIV